MQEGEPLRAALARGLQRRLGPSPVFQSALERGVERYAAAKQAEMDATPTVTAQYPRRERLMTSLLGTGEGAHAARARVRMAAERGEPERASTVEQLKAVPSEMKRMFLDQPPQMPLLEAAGKADPVVEAITEHYKAREFRGREQRALGAQLPQGVPKVEQGPTGLPIVPKEELGGTAFKLAPREAPRERFTPLQRGALRALRRESPETIQGTGDVEQATYEHLSAIEAGDAEKFRKEHSVQNAVFSGLGHAPAVASVFGGTKKVLGKAIQKLSPLRQMVTIGSAGEVALQGQRILAGGQEAPDPVSGVLNVLTLAGGGLVGRAAGNRYLAGRVPTEEAIKTAETITAAVADTAQNVAMGGISAGEAVAKGEFSWGELGTQMLQGLVETGVMAAAAQTHPAVIRRPRGAPEGPADPVMDSALEALTAAAEKRRAAEDGPEPEASPELKQKATEAAQNVLLMAEAPPNREARRRALEEGLLADAPAEKSALADALQAVERDMGEGSAGDRLMMAHEDYAERIGDQFGLDREGRRLVHEHALDTYTRPAEAKLDRTLEAARALRDEMRRNPESVEANRPKLEEAVQRLRDQAASVSIRKEVMRELLGPDATPKAKRKRGTRGEVINPYTAIAEGEAARRERMRPTEEAFEDQLRGQLDLASNAVKRTLRRKGGFLGRALAPETGDRELGTKAEVSRGHMQEALLEGETLKRDLRTFLESTPNPKTTDRAFVLAAELGPEDGASVVASTMPKETAAKFNELLRRYTDVMEKLGKGMVESGKLPVAVWELKETGPDGEPSVRRVSQMHGEGAPEGGKLVGGFEKYRRRYVHHAYARTLRESMRTGEMDPTLWSEISAPSPGFLKRRTKSGARFYEEGKVSIEPTLDLIHKQALVAHIGRLQKFVASRPDLVMEDNSSAPAKIRNAVQQAHADMAAIKKERAALIKEMRTKGLPIYADESGPLLDEMALRKSKAFTALNNHTDEMRAGKIPFEGYPDGFDPKKRGNAKRAGIIQKAQRRYRELLKTANLYHQVERPDTLYGKKTRAPPAVEAANLKLRELEMRFELAENQAAGFVKATGKNFGELEGKLVNRAALKAIHLESASMGRAGQLFDAAHRLAKVGLVAHNPLASGIMQFVSNVAAFPVGGLHLSPSGIGEQVRAIRHLIPYVFKGERAKDPILDAVIESGLMQNAGLMADVPEATRRKIDATLAQAQAESEAGNAGEAVRLWTIATFDFLRWAPSEIPLFGTATRAFRLVDLVPMYGMIRQLVTGNGSGRPKMSPERAIRFARDYFDLNDVPAALREGVLRHSLSFQRFTYKAATALVKWMMLSPLSIGIPFGPKVLLPRPFGNLMKTKAGTPAATRAVWFNAALGAAQTATKLALAWKGTQAFFESQLGIDGEDEEYKDRKLAEAGGSDFKAAMLIPVGKKPNGDIEFYDAWRLTPWMAPFNPFGIGQESASDLATPTKAFRWLVGLNVVARPFGNILSGTNWRGQPFEEGEAWWEAIRWALPSGFTVPAEMSVAKIRGKTGKSWKQIAAQTLLGQRLVTSEPGEEFRYRINVERAAAGTKMQAIKVPINETFKAKLMKKMMDVSPYGARKALRDAAQK